MNTPLLVTQRQAAELLGCTERQIHALRMDGKLQAVKDGSRIKIVYSSITDYVSTLKSA